GLVPQVAHHGLYLRLLGSGQRQERQARRPAIVPAEFTSVFKSRDAHFGSDPFGGRADALLLLLGKLQVTVLPSRIDFVAGRGSSRCECQYGGAWAGLVTQETK